MEIISKVVKHLFLCYYIAVRVPWYNSKHQPHSCNLHSTTAVVAHSTVDQRLRWNEINLFLSFAMHSQNVQWTVMMSRRDALYGPELAHRKIDLAHMYVYTVHAGRHTYTIHITVLNVHQSIATINWPSNVFSFRAEWKRNNQTIKWLHTYVFGAYESIPHIHQPRVFCPTRFY